MKKIMISAFSLVAFSCFADSIIDSTKWIKVNPTKNYIVENNINFFIKNCHKLTEDKYLEFTNLKFRGLQVKYYIPSNASGEGDYWSYIFNASESDVKKAIPDIIGRKKIKMTKEQAKYHRDLELFISGPVDFNKNMTTVTCGGGWKHGLIDPED